MRFPGTRAVSGYSIPMITELINDTNVQFLDQDDDDGKFADPLPLRMSWSFRKFGRNKILSGIKFFQDTMVILNFCPNSVFLV